MSDFSQLLQLNLTNETIEFNFSKDLKSSLKRFLLDLKIQVDRWDLVSDSYVFNHEIEDIVHEFVTEDKSNQLWGATLYFTKDIPNYTVFAISSIEAEDNRHIALGILPSANLRKYYDLKAFW